MKPVFYLLWFTLILGCKPVQHIQTGDIVFRGAGNSNLSTAINEVTQTSNKQNYTHMGVCKVDGSTVYVYHADYNKGVVKEPLKQFQSLNTNESYIVDVYRIKTIKKKNIKAAVSYANTLVGNNYNNTYILDDQGFYCSEFIYEIFKKDSIFKLEPMTFKNPETNEFHEGWITHYKDLGIPIPEGKLGCNPNGMASSKRLTFIKTLH